MVRTPATMSISALLCLQVAGVAAGQASGPRADIDTMPTEQLVTLLAKHEAIAGTGHENRGLMRLLRLELAQRGDVDQRERLFANLHSSDLAEQARALDDVAAIGDREAVRQLGQMLYDPGNGGRYKIVRPNGEVTITSQAFLPPRMVAAMKLAELIASPPVVPIGPTKKFYTEEDVALWQAWWRERSDSSAGFAREPEGAGEALSSAGFAPESRARGSPPSFTLTALVSVLAAGLLVLALAVRLVLRRRSAG